MTDIVLASDLTISRGGRTLVSGLTLGLSAGSVTALTGPNGSGKTTLARCLGLYDLDFNGTVRVDDRATQTISARELRALHQGTIVIQPQELMLEPSWSALRNLTYAAWALGLPRRCRKRTAHEVLERVGASHLANTTVERLSGGEQARIAIARLLLSPDPRLMILDEPTASGDRALRDLVSDVIRSTVGRGAAVLLISHDQALRSLTDVEIPVGADASGAADRTHRS
ncbi:MAG: ATP-binding cassette domain-containing protein [Actinomyces sp.]|uniref:ATP-binding cassette domain-containing protein n=1 Tax=Actinomyces sp. TaxID=29317 RepID=UPI0026DCADDD|nr:ATP-binding cassette domain-containing protein [Actinomyces sp.]MDO4242611.1 ATP-binding cassette domain-containing protein [Actinomyces sp.]